MARSGWFSELFGRALKDIQSKLQAPLGGPNQSQQQQKKIPAQTKEEQLAEAKHEKSQAGLWKAVLSEKEATDRLAKINAKLAQVLSQSQGMSPSLMPLLKERLVKLQHKIEFQRATVQEKVASSKEATFRTTEAREAYEKTIPQARPAEQQQQQGGFWKNLTQNLGQHFADKVMARFGGARAFGIGAGEAAAGAEGAEAAGAATGAGGAALGGAGGPLALGMWSIQQSSQSISRGLKQLASAQSFGQTFGGVGRVVAGTTGSVGLGELAARIGDATDKLRQWTSGLVESNLRIGQFSPAMGMVEMQRDIQMMWLSMERGNRRAASTRSLVEGQVQLERTMAPFEDNWARIKNAFVEANVRGANMIMETPIMRLFGTLLQRIADKVDPAGGAEFQGNWMQWQAQAMGVESQYFHYGVPDKFKTVQDKEERWKTW